MPGPRPRFFAALALAAAGTLSCGASIRAMYEGDVRFEHCMALDASPDVKPAVRHACWDEWLTFYTFGQTRDRIDYAQLRHRQSGDTDEADRNRLASAAVTAAAPDPTSAIAPPPITMTAADAGAPEPDERTVARNRCISGCASGYDSCRDRCKKTAPCTAACTARKKRCDDHCGEAPQGSR